MIKNNVILMITGLILLVLFIFRKPIDKAMSRGLRNKNPGNIRLTPTMWKGEVKGADKDFKTFKDMGWGYRALFALLKEYISKGYNTIDKIINRYAPGNENNTEAYIQAVVNKTGIERDKVLTFGEAMKIKSLVKAISYVENGVPADVVDVEAGYTLLNKT